MPKSYQKSDIKNPQNKYVFTNGTVVLDSKLVEFQRLAYTIQLGEQTYGYTGSVMPVWVTDPVEYNKIGTEMEDALSSLLDSQVGINFRKDNGLIPYTQTQFNQTKFDFICLFSGGLDSSSFALQNASKKKSGILHHTITHDNPFGKAKKLYQKYFLSCNNLKFVTTRGDNKVLNPAYLKTRGLIFLTNVLCIASQLKIEEIVIPENGPFMINLNVSPVAEPTRTTDPNMLEDWTIIFNKVTNSKVKINMPFKTSTKSEVILFSGSKSLINDTWSCSHYQGLSKMCGLCNSCLVRILSCYAICEGENIESMYEDNPFLVKSNKLKNSNKNSYRISIDAIDFWASIINPDNSRNDIEKQKFDSINSLYPVMTKHALDMFLGFKKLSQVYNSSEPLFSHFNKTLQKIDASQLKTRSEELEREKHIRRWS